MEVLACHLLRLTGFKQEYKSYNAEKPFYDLKPWKTWEN